MQWVVLSYGGPFPSPAGVVTDDRACTVLAANLGEGERLLRAAPAPAGASRLWAEAVSPSHP